MLHYDILFFSCFLVAIQIKFLHAHSQTHLVYSYLLPSLLLLPEGKGKGENTLDVVRKQQAVNRS